MGNKRIHHIRSWLKTLTLSFFSFFSCGCFFGGCCGLIDVPGENPIDNNELRKSINIVKWYTLANDGVQCLPVCGVCLGLCGEFGPEHTRIYPSY